MSEANEAAERLVRHAPFLRALAAALLRDGDAADDVLQDAWLATRGRGPVEPARERSWLAGVVRNLSFHRRRESARREARDLAPREAGEVPTPHEVLEEEAARRRVLDAVLALEEPWRSVLLLRFWKGCALGEVARRTGAPVETVRARQRRALELLRQRLDRDFGSRASWAVALAPMAGLGAATGGTAAAPTIPFLWGSIAMGAKTWCVAAGALAAVAASVVWWSWAGGAAGAAKSDPGGGAAIAARGDWNPNDLPEAAGAVDPSSRGSRAQAEAELRPAPTRVTGRFLDRDGKPVAGVKLFGAERQRATHEIGPARLDPAPAPGPPIAESDGAGAFVWTDESAGVPGTHVSYSWLAIRSGIAMKTISIAAVSGATTALGDLVVAPGGEVAGLVVDPAGKPLRAAVELWPTSDAGFDPKLAKLYGVFGNPLRAVASQENGAFEIAGAPCGSMRVAAYSHDRCFAFTEPLNLAAGERRTGVRLVLEPIPDTCTIEGKVVKPDGSPCPGAEIRYKIGGSIGMFFAERDGRFHHRLPLDERVRYEAKDGRDAFCVARADRVPGGTRDLVLRLEPLRACTLRLLSSQGGPVAKAILRVDDGYLPGMGDQIFLDDPKGEIRIVALPAPFRIEIDAPGHEPKKVGPLERESLPETLEVTLQKVASISGRVLREGKPVVGALVSVEMAVADGKCDGFPCRSIQVSEVPAVRTDAEGRFDLRPPKPIRFAFVRAVAGPNPDNPNPTIAPAELGPFVFDPKVGLDGVELILGNGGELAGRVLLPEGRDATRLIVGVSRGDGHPRTITLAADGAYRFAHLTPGRYAVAILDQHADWGTGWSMGEPAAVPEVPTVCVVEEGKTTSYDIDFRAGVAVVLSGRIAFGAHRWEGFEVSATPWNEASLGLKAPLSLDGRYRFDLPHGGTWSISVSNPKDPRALEVRFHVDVAAMGETESQFSPLVGSIRGKLKEIATPGSARIHFGFGPTGSVYVGGTVVPSADGSFTIDPAPAGVVRLALDGPDGKLVSKKAIEVPAGGAVEITLP